MSSINRNMIAAIVALLCTISIVSASDIQTETVKRPVGVWKMQVTFTACDTGAPIRDPFPALNTFYADGNVSETAAGLSPAFRSVSFGRWRWVDSNRIAVKSEIQLFDTNFIYWASQVFDRRLWISESGNTMAGRATYVRYGVDGTELFRGCWTEEGKRMR